MSPWTLSLLALAGVLLSAGTGRGGAPHRYLRAAAPLLYGGAVAWMFLEQAPLLALQVILFGSLLPTALLGWLWWREGRKPRA